MKNIVDEVRYSKSAQKFIKTRDANEKQRIKDIIEKILSTYLLLAILSH